MSRCSLCGVAVSSPLLPPMTTCERCASPFCVTCAGAATLVVPAAEDATHDSDRCCVLCTNDTGLRRVAAEEQSAVTLLAKLLDVERAVAEKHYVRMTMNVDGYSPEQTRVAIAHRAGTDRRVETLKRL
jgi:hypothetical protein